MKSQSSCLLLLTALLQPGLTVQAEPLTFNFKDPKGVNNVVFKLDAPLEAINGSANGITGSVVFDPTDPAKTQGKITVASSSLHVPNPMMKEHLHGDKWLDVARHPEISFEAKELQNVNASGGTITATARGTFTLKGISKEMTVPVKLSYLKDKLAARVPNQKGDLLVLRSTFSIQRSDFNIMPGQNEDKVSNEIELTLSIAGAAPRSP
jgi:polyisoprenoid-binding protein YceI